MKLRRILILIAAAFIGSKLYHVISAAVVVKSPEERSAYSSVTGKGSLWQTFQTARDSATAQSQQRARPYSPAANNADNNLAAGGLGKVGAPYAAPNNANFQNGTSVGIPDDPQLLEAAAKGDAALLEKRLDAHSKVNSRDGDRRTPLMYASWGGYNDICGRLLAAGANIDLEDHDGNKAFDYAAGRGLTDTLQLLLERSHNTDDHHYLEYASIIQAIYSGDPARLPEGQGKLASVNRIDPQGRAPLHVVAGNGSVALAEILIKRGAQVDVVNIDKQTPLHWAAWNNQTATAELLLSKGADINAADSGGNTALMIASQNNNIDMVKLLLSKGASKDTANKEGKTAYITAQEKGYKDLAAILK